MKYYATIRFDLKGNGRDEAVIAIGQIAAMLQIAEEKGTLQVEHWEMSAFGPRSKISHHSESGQ